MGNQRDHRKNQQQVNHKSGDVKEYEATDPEECKAKPKNGPKRIITSAVLANLSTVLRTLLRAGGEHASAAVFFGHENAAKPRTGNTRKGVETERSLRSIHRLEKKSGRTATLGCELFLNSVEWVRGTVPVPR